MTLTYDSATGAVQTTQAQGEPAPSVFTYWPAGQLKSATDPGGRSVNYSYDSLGHLGSIADSQGRAVQLFTDAAGQLRSATDELGNQTKFDYYPDGTLSVLTDANPAPVALLLRGPAATTPSAGSAWALGFLRLQLKQRSDRNGAPDGITTFGYDVDGLLTQETRPNNDVTNFTYDPLGRLVETDNSSSHVDRIYDDASRLSTETTCANTGSPTIPCTPAGGSATQPTVTLTYDYFPDSAEISDQLGRRRRAVRV